MDRKDLQLLEIISNNCRISNTEIGQMLNLSKNSIISRKEKLIENNIYTNNNLIIDSRVLGYTIYQLFIQLDSNIINKEKILDKLKKYNRAIWINTFIGSYNLQIIVDAKNSLEFDILKNEIFELCENKVKKYTVLTHLYDIEFSQLNPDLNFNLKIIKKK